MGEYAKYGRTEIKIGTCEEMYYLRAGQAYKVKPLPGNVDPCDEETRRTIRFRFPWPNEDNIEPGAFEPYERAVHVPGIVAPADVEHGSVQFRAEPGYLLFLPCPESPTAREFRDKLAIHKNGWRGDVLLVQQAWRDNKLVIIAMCGGCGTKWNVPTFEDAKPYLEACMKESEQRKEGDLGFWREVARRIKLGYEGVTV